jgi:hypothetical protein
MFPPKAWLTHLLHAEALVADVRGALVVVRVWHERSHGAVVVREEVLQPVERSQVALVDAEHDVLEALRRVVRLWISHASAHTDESPHAAKPTRTQTHPHKRTHVDESTRSPQAVPTQ